MEYLLTLLSRTEGCILGEPPTVTISGGSGSWGHCGSHYMTAGVVTSITLTSAGSGYLAGDVLTVAFSGGSPASGTLIDLIS